MVFQVDITRILIELTLYAKSGGKRYNDNTWTSHYTSHYGYSAYIISPRLKLSTCRIIGYDKDDQAGHYYFSVIIKGHPTESIIRCIRGSDPYK